MNITHKFYALILVATVFISTPLRCSDEITAEISSENTSASQNSNDKPKDATDLVIACSCLIAFGFFIFSMIKHEQMMKKYNQEMREFFSQYGVSSWEELFKQTELQAISDAAPLYV